MLATLRSISDVPLVGQIHINPKEHYDIACGYWRGLLPLTMESFVDGQGFETWDEAYGPQDRWTSLLLFFWFSFNFWVLGWLGNAHSKKTGLYRRGGAPLTWNRLQTDRESMLFVCLQFLLLVALGPQLAKVPYTPSLSAHSPFSW